MESNSNKVPIDHSDSDNEKKKEKKSSNENNENKKIDDDLKQMDKDFINMIEFEETKRQKELEFKKKKEDDEKQKSDEYNDKRMLIRNIFIPKEEYKKDNFYDIIIKINSLNELTLDGWEIAFSQKFIKDNKKFNNVNLIPVSVIGESNKGKSYLLAKISNSVLPEGFTEKTEGISVKFLFTEILKCVLIDSAGGQTPIIKNKKNDKYFINLIKEIQIKDGKNQIKKKYEKNNEKDKNNNEKNKKNDEKNKKNDEEIKKMEEEKKKMEEEIKKMEDEINKKKINLDEIKIKDENIFDRCLKKIILDKSMTEQFIKDFVLFTSRIIFIVVGQLTITEQLFINNLKTNIGDNKEIIIIHNLLNFVKIKQVEDYINEVLKKSIYFNLQERIISEIDYDENEVKQKSNQIYYIEQFDQKEGKNSITIRHVIFANDSKESEAGNYYNYSTIKFLRNIIMTVSNPKHFNIIQELRDFLYDKSPIYIELNNEQKMLDKKDEKKIIFPIDKKNIKIINKDNLNIEIIKDEDKVNNEKNQNEDNVNNENNQNEDNVNNENNQNEDNVNNENNQNEDNVKKCIMKIVGLNNLNLKRLITDESGNFKYTGNAFVPPFSYHKEIVKRNFLNKKIEGNKGEKNVEVFVIVIELAGKIEEFRPKINQGGGKYNISISGVKKVPEVNNISYLYTDEDENEFRIEFVINMDEFELKSNKPIKNYTKNGIIKLYYEIKSKEGTKTDEIKIKKKKDEKIKIDSKKTNDTSEKNNEEIKKKQKK